MKKKVSTREIVGYSIAGVIALFGIVLLIFGIIERNMDTTLAKNFIYQADQKVQNALGIKISFRGWGLIFMAIGLIIAMIILCVAAKHVDRENDKKIRRQARAGGAIDISSEVKKAVEIIEEPAPQPAPEVENK